VYTLHILVMALTLFLLLQWSLQPTTGRLACFFAAYAISFGNHLSMILLAPAYTVFLFAAAPRRWRSIVSPRVVTLAATLAAVAALQYLWNLAALWHGPDAPPRDLPDALRAFWFDVTKSDWRDTMVLRVPAVMLGERMRMYLFDLRQQFGIIAPIIACLGIVHLVRTQVRRAVLLLTAYAATLIFALGYNVGDSHVFFLPSHLIVALAIAPGIVFAQHAIAWKGVIAVGAIALAGVRIYHDYPALDRSNDHRPTEALQRLTLGLEDRHAMLLTDLNWQIENGLNHFINAARPEVLYTRLPNVILYAPALIGDNVAIGRTVVVTDRARASLQAAYGPLFTSRPDDRAPVVGLSDLVDDVPPGTRYVLSLLRPSRDFSLDFDDLRAGLNKLTGGSLRELGANDYSVVAGLAGAEPELIRSDNAPFRTTVSLNNVRVDVRMESWLAFDTIRRMGFGQIVAARRHVLIVERGVSFAAFDAEGHVLQSGYTAGIFASQPRYLISPGFPTDR
jgi:hypothetical protein